MAKTFSDFLKDKKDNEILCLNIEILKRDKHKDNLKINGKYYFENIDKKTKKKVDYNDEQFWYNGHYELIENINKYFHIVQLNLNTENKNVVLVNNKTRQNELNKLDKFNLESINIVNDLLDKELAMDPTSPYYEYALKHILLEDSKLDFILNTLIVDFTYSTDIKKNLNNTTLVQLSNILQSADFYEEVKKYNYGNNLVDKLVREFHNAGTNKMLSFVSKLCANYNRLRYSKDDYYIYDSILDYNLDKFITTSALSKLYADYRKNKNYKNYYKLIDSILEENKLDKVKDIRKLFDRYVWRLYNTNK